MASNGDTKDVTSTMDKLSLNGSSKFQAPHHKYGLVPRPPPPTPADSSMKDTAQVTPTNAQIKNVLASEKEQDTKKNYPHHNYAATKNTTPAPTSTTKEADIADSWEEEASDTEPDQSNLTSVPEPDQIASAINTTLESTDQATTKPPIDFAKAPHNKYANPPAPPPPTPASPSTTNRTLSPRPTPAPTSTPPDRRPEKTMAVANRLIAGALGVKAPRRTEEQRNYDKAVREQERKKRDAEREAKKRAEEEAARAKAAIWDD